MINQVHLYCIPYAYLFWSYFLIIIHSYSILLNRMSETTTPPPQDLETVISAESLSKANGEDSENLWVALYVTKFGKIYFYLEYNLYIT